MRANLRDLEVENRILDAVDRLLARDSYHRLALEDVTHEAGLTQDRLLLHFRTKEDMVLALTDRLAGRIVAMERKIAARPEPPASRIRQILLGRVLAYFDGVQHFADSLDEVFRDLRTELMERRQSYAEWEADVVGSILRETHIVNELTPNGVIGTARALLSATDSLLPFNCISSDLGTRRQLAKRAERVTSLVVRGLFGVVKPRQQTNSHRPKKAVTKLLPVLRRAGAR